MFFYPIYQYLTLLDDFMSSIAFAFGFFLQETEEGMFAETDEYITHCVNTGDNISTKSIFLITDR